MNSEAASFAEEYFSGLYEGSKLNIESCKREIGRLEVKLREANVSLEYWIKVRTAYENNVSFFKEIEKKESVLGSLKEEVVSEDVISSEINRKASKFKDLQKLIDVFDIKEKVTFEVRLESDNSPRVCLPTFECGPNVKLSEYFKREYIDILSIPAHVSARIEDGEVHYVLWVWSIKTAYGSQRLQYFLDTVVRGVQSTQRMASSASLGTTSLWHKMKNNKKEEAVVRK